VVGPNLDVSKPSIELAVERVTNGARPSNVEGRASGMPSFADRLSREEIEAVANYVAEAARK
jgi:mono/diheme cytochrome c family protein